MFFSFIKNEIVQKSIILLIVIISTFIIGVTLGKTWKKCPEVETGIVITTDTIFVHDTIKAIQKIDKIKKSVETKIVYITDHDTVKVINDSDICYTVSDTIKGAKIEAKLCSKFFPPAAPDIHSSILYLPPPQVTVERLRIDTITLVTPWYRQRKNYLISGLVACLAGSIYLNIR